MNIGYSHNGNRTMAIALTGERDIQQIADADTLIMEFLKSRSWEESTKKTYRKALNVFFSWAFTYDKILSMFTEDDIVAFVNHLRSEHKSTPTISLYVTSIRLFYTWAKTRGLIPVNITENISVRRKSTARFEKLHLRDSEVFRLLEWAAARSYRDYVILLLMINTGLRTFEVSNLDICDISLIGETKVLYVRSKGKDTKEDYVVVNDVLDSALMKYINIYRSDALGEDPIFICTGRRNKGQRLSTREIQFIARTGMNSINLTGHKYSAHSLRHTAAVNILLSGGNMFDVQTVLRHASVETSQIYTESIREQQRLTAPPEQRLSDKYRNMIATIENSVKA